MSLLIALRVAGLKQFHLRQQTRKTPPDGIWPLTGQDFLTLPDSTYSRE